MMPPPRSHDFERGGFKRGLSIFVNGERQARVLSYSVDDGFVRKIATDEHGFILVERGEVVEEIVQGHVQIAWQQERARA